jgi:hypothetical protein
MQYTHAHDGNDAAIVRLQSAPGAMRKIRPSSSPALRSVVSPPLRQMSSNLQRLPPGSGSCKDSYLNTPNGKRRRLKARSRSPIQDNARGDATPEISCDTLIPFTLLSR